MYRVVNRPYVVGVLVGMLNMGVGSYFFQKNLLTNWWNMLLVMVGINIALLIGSVIAHRVAAQVEKETDA